MSIFGPHCRQQAGLPIEQGTGTPLGYTYMVLWVNGGLIESSLDAAITHHANGIPFDADGRMATSTAAVNYVDQGVPFTATGHVAVSSDPVAYHDQGIPYAADGRITFTVVWTPPEWGPPEPVSGYYHDFTTASLDVFTHTRSSVATGTDFEDNIFEVANDEPVFIGHRRVENLVTETPSGISAGVTFTPQGGGVYAVDGLVNTGTSARFSPEGTTEPIDGRTYLWTADLKGEGADIGKVTQLHVKRFQGGSFVGGTRVVTLTADWVRYTISVTGGAGNQGVETQFAGTAGGDVASGVLVRNWSCEEVTGQSNVNPADFVPYEEVEYFDTENGNTVDGSGIVTEAPGAPLSTLAGLQLEATRTNRAIPANLTDPNWTKAGTAVVTREEGNGPDGGPAYHITGDNTSWVANSATVAVDPADRLSIYARTVTGTGTAQLLVHNSVPFLANLTEDWQRFDTQGHAGSGGANFYVADFRGGGTLSEYKVALPQLELGPFMTSYITTTSLPVTRAITLASSPLSAMSVPDLTNNFCGQLVIRVPYDGTLSKGIWFSALEMDSSDPAQNILTLWISGDDDRLYLRKVVAGVLKEIVTPALGYMAGDVLDLRYRVSSTTGITLWVNGTPYTQGSATEDYTDPLILAALGDSGVPPMYTYQQFRLVPEALTDEEIEAW